MNREILTTVLERTCRYYVCFFLLVYGIGKLVGGQFYRPGALPEAEAATPLGEVLPFDLAWTFMGYSTAYIAFVGISQVISALLLLTKRTKLLGVTVVIPILLNIVVFDIIFLDAYAALANAMIYLIMLLLILYFNREQVRAAFRALTQEQKLATSAMRQPPKGKVEGAGFPRWQLLLAILPMTAITFGFNQSLNIYFGFGKG